MIGQRVARHDVNVQPVETETVAPATTKAPGTPRPVTVVLVAEEAAAAVPAEAVVQPLSRQPIRGA